MEGVPELNIHDGPIMVAPEGPDWGDYAVEMFMAKRALGMVGIDDEVPNRVITIPLVLGASGDFDVARVALQAWAARVNHHGGDHLKREIIGGSYGEAGKKLFADIVKANLKLGGGTAPASNGIDPDAQLVLEALPDFYGPWENIAPFEGTGSASTTLLVKGNYPARTVLTAKDKSGVDQLGLAYHLRCRNYSSAATAKWRYEAEELLALDTAAEGSLAGASGGKAIRHESLGSDWTPILALRLKAGTYLTHTGLYDVWARVYTTSETLPWLRLLHDVGDTVAPAANVQLQIPGASNFHLVNLGQVNLQRGPFGAHRWLGVIQGRGEEGGENVYIDSVELHCADENSGVSTGRTGIRGPVSSQYLWRDEFNQTAGEATGKSSPVAGVLSAITNSDADDFEVDAASHRLVRTAVSDTGTISANAKGRAIGPSVEVGDFALRNDFEITSASFTNIWPGQIIGHASSSAFVLVHFIFFAGTGWNVRVVVGGVGVGFWGNELVPGLGTTNGGTVQATLMTVRRGNRITVYAGALGKEPKVMVTAEESALGEKGKVAIFDMNSGTTAATRYYDNVALWTPEDDAVMYANQDAKLSDQGIYRMGSDGGGYGPVARPGADLPRLPAAGPEEQPVEIVLRPSRGDFDSIADSGIDEIEGSGMYRPCWATVPGP